MAIGFHYLLKPLDPSVRLLECSCRTQSSATYQLRPATEETEIPPHFLTGRAGNQAGPVLRTGLRARLPSKPQAGIGPARLAGNAAGPEASSYEANWAFAAIAPSAPKRYCGTAPSPWAFTNATVPGECGQFTLQSRFVLNRSPLLGLH